MAETLRALGSEKAWLVHGMDGTDEISIAAPTYVAALEGGKVTQFTIKPEDAGLHQYPFGEILGGTPEDNAAKMRALLAGEQSPALAAFRHAVMLNAAAALLVAGRTATLAEGVPLAAAVLGDGRARGTLERLVKVSNGR
jgi:anthranilate phosphoribosyltransferase